MVHIRDEAVDWSSIYQNAQTNIWERSPHEFSRLAVGVTEPGLALDIGCGEGYDALFFAENGYDTTAVDISRAALEGVRQIARKKGLDVKTVEGDATTFEIAEQQVIIASFGVLHFIGKNHTERIEYFKERTVDGGVHALYVFGDSGDFHDIAGHKFWFPSMSSLSDIYHDWEIERLEAKNTEMLIRGDNGEILHNQLIKLLAKKK